MRVGDGDEGSSDNPWGVGSLVGGELLDKGKVVLFVEGVVLALG